MISIITPYRNAEQWIGRCCESMQHTLGDFEFILVDDSSSDLGPDIVADYATLDSRIRNLYNERWPGVSGSRNTGLDHANGDWIAFLDADDAMHPDAAETFRTVISWNKSANIYQFNHMRHYRDGRRAMKYANPVGWYDLDCLPNRWMMVWNKLYRRGLIQDNGIRFFEDLQYGEDELFTLECLAKDNRIYCWSGVTVTKHFDNTQSLSKKKTAEDLILQNHALEDFLLRQWDPVVRRAVCRIMANHWESKTYLRLLGLQGEK